MTPSYPPRVLILAALLLVVPGCGNTSSDAGTVMPRETFIETYVDLRVAALRSADAVLTDSARAEILARRGVSEDELIDFVTVRGTELDFMRDLWNEIEMRMDSVPPIPADSLS
jgi:hypothetical protein